MTALDRYVRLESDALWRAGPDAQKRDVTLSFGDATLVIADGAARPLAHWSLPALVRLNQGDVPALYAPDTDESETLEISDTTMVEAIEEVRKALAKARPRPGKLRHWLTGGLIVTTLLLAIFWLPGALTRQTLAVVPATKRAEIGATMLGFVETRTGGLCQSPRAVAATERLSARLFGTGTQITVARRLPHPALALPGDIIVLDDRVLQATDDPAATAGFLLAAKSAMHNADPLEDLLKEAGLNTTFRLLTTGDIPAAVLRDDTFRRLESPAKVAPDTLRQRFAAANVPQAPYLAAVDSQTGSMPDIAPDPLDGRATPIILTDSDWVALQNICNR